MTRHRGETRARPRAPHAVGDWLHGRLAQAEATKAALRAGIEHAKQSGDRAYLGRKPSFTREQFVEVCAMLGHETVGIAQIARDTGLTRQTVYRIKGDPAGAEGGWDVRGCADGIRNHSLSRPERVDG
jgi:hypothetical protein